MRIREAIRNLRYTLGNAGVPDDDIEAEVLVMHSLGWDRVRLLQSAESFFPSKSLDFLQDLTRRRVNREPLAYVLGYREFYGLAILVSKHVLIPRQESELLIDAALQILPSLGSGSIPLVADIGTGSGALAIALAVHNPAIRIVGTDCSRQALSLAHKNIRRHQVHPKVFLCQGDLVDPLSCQLDLLIANPPYIPSSDFPILQPEVRDYEPRAALDGGPNGLTIIKRLLTKAPSSLKPNGHMLMEVGFKQANQVLTIAQETFPDRRISFLDDFQGIPRVLHISDR